MSSVPCYLCDGEGCEECDGTGQRYSTGWDVEPGLTIVVSGSGHGELSAETRAAFEGLARAASKMGVSELRTEMRLTELGKKRLHDLFGIEGIDTIPVDPAVVGPHPHVAHYPAASGGIPHSLPSEECFVCGRGRRDPIHQ